MKFSIKKRADKINLFRLALCNGLPQLTIHGIEIVYNKDEYKQTREIFKDKTSICYEDVLIKMLETGRKISFIDSEKSLDDVDLTIDQVVNNLNKQNTKVKIIFLKLKL